MAKSRGLSKPKPRTLKAAEKELHNGRSAKPARRAAGYVVKNAKGVKEKGRK